MARGKNPGATAHVGIELIEQIPASDLKSILHSKRANIYFVEHCRLLVKGGRVIFHSDRGSQ
jgi:CRISPR-associated protein Cas1